MLSLVKAHRLYRETADEALASRSSACDACVCRGGSCVFSLHSEVSMKELEEQDLKKKHQDTEAH